MVSACHAGTVLTLTACVWGLQHAPPVLRSNSDLKRQQPAPKERTSRWSGFRLDANEKSSAAASASAEVLWTWVPRLVIGLAVLVIALEVVPRASTLVGEIRGWRSDIARVTSSETLVQDRAFLRAEQARLARELASMSTERATTGDMLGRLDALAADSEVNLTRVEPGVPVSEGSQERVPLAVDLRGRFHDVGQYVSELEASTFRVRRLSLSRSARSGARQSTGMLEATLSLEVVRTRQTGGRDA